MVDGAKQAGRVAAAQLPWRSLNASGGVVSLGQGSRGADVAVGAWEHKLGRAGDFPGRLKTWRQKRRLSQLELALAANVSQRHLSFLESGRASPSRLMIQQLSDTLDIPLRDRNELLIAAGFAPIFAARGLDDPDLAQVMGAVRLLLGKHAPFPGVAVDRAWNIRLANAPFDRLIEVFGADVWQRIGGGAPNLMRLFFHPGGLRPLVANWTQVAPLLWRRAQREAEALDGQDMAAVLAALAPLQDAQTLGGAADAALLPVLPLEIARDGVRLALFGVIATFGTAQDVTADELRIELLFPADVASEALLRGLAG